MSGRWGPNVTRGQLLELTVELFLRGMDPAELDDELENSLEDGTGTDTYDSLRHELGLPA